ncbi:hypothetical protein CBL_11310 [Carabus blaptoides fortunei]
MDMEQIDKKKTASRKLFLLLEIGNTLIVSFFAEGVINLSSASDGAATLRPASWVAKICVYMRFAPVRVYAFNNMEITNCFVVTKPPTLLLATPFAQRQSQASHRENVEAKSLLGFGYMPHMREFLAEQRIQGVVLLPPLLVSVDDDGTDTFRSDTTCSTSCRDFTQTVGADGIISLALRIKVPCEGAGWSEDLVHLQL